MINDTTALVLCKTAAFTLVLLFTNLVFGVEPVHAQIGEIEILTLLGGANDGEDAETGTGTTPYTLVDTSGALLIYGFWTNEFDLPVSPNAYQKTYPGIAGGTSECIYLAVFSLDCSQLLYATYLGGSGVDRASSLIWYDNDNILISGVTTSSDLPVTADAQQNTLRGGTDLWYAVFNVRNMEFSYISYVGGGDSEHHGGCLLTEDGRLLLVGATWSRDLPCRPGTISHIPNSQGDAVVFVLEDHELQYAVCFGGSYHDFFTYAAETDDSFVFVGGSWSRDMPTTENAYQQDFGGTEELCIVRIDKEFRTLLYSTFIGGRSNEYANCVTQSKNILHIGGYSGSAFDEFPLSQPPIGDDSLGFAGGMYVIYDTEADSILFSGLFVSKMAAIVGSCTPAGNDRVLLSLYTRADSLLGCVKDPPDGDDPRTWLDMLVFFDVLELKPAEVQYLHTGERYSFFLTGTLSDGIIHVSGIMDEQPEVRAGGYQTKLNGWQDAYIGRLKLHTTHVEGHLPESPRLLTMMPFPNPARSDATVLVSGVPGRIHLRLLGIDGRVHWSRYLEPSCQMVVHCPLPLASLAKGRYTLIAYDIDGHAIASSAVVVE
ncbi:MAG: hypothetical protein JXA28_11075 [Bacteroidetes bacterium]|nr:hypothetical protein [Bacteroidota bacterium]